jgi:hypothetical protein
MDAGIAKSRNDLSLFCLIVGVAFLVIGGLNLLSYAGFGQSMDLYDAGFNCASGLLLLLCRWMVSRGNSLALIVAGGFILAGMLYPFAVGRGFNYYFLFLALIILPWLYSLWKNGALS